MIITIQDIKARSIWWFLPLLLFVAGILANPELKLEGVIVNVLFILFILLFLVVYVRIRFGQNGKEFFNYFGLGDVLFLIAITPLFQLHQFVYFFTFGTCCSLLFHFILSFFRMQKDVPYAGYLSVCLFALLILKEMKIVFFNSVVV